ncbi:TPA: hypothetical protein HA251_08250 [Candidatus Woesearchaeota archaeon]|nr:hypothetical protein [Candidatus Woesearchaeota archaeon]
MASNRAGIFAGRKMWPPLVWFTFAIIACILAGSAVSATIGNISAAHSPSSKYITEFNRPANYTLNITRVPGILRGVTPKLQPPTDLQYDRVRNPGTVLMDPRTCYNDLAYCYQTIDHLPQNRTTLGKNYSGVSSYELPETRIRTFVCVGDDRACVKSATFCYCPQETLPPMYLMNTRGKCSARTHLCMNSYSSLTTCDGNLTDCQKKYLSCGCGVQDCIAPKNTCMNTRGQLTLCEGPIDLCIKKFGTCYCGPDMLNMQTGCSTSAHECSKDGVISICYGSLNACAPRYDWCDC